jgi:hypothetical protein
MRTTVLPEANVVNSVDAVASGGALAVEGVSVALLVSILEARGISIGILETIRRRFTNLSRPICIGKEI